MKKRINPITLAALLFAGRVNIDLKFPKRFAELPDDPEGVEVTEEQVKAIIDDIWSYGEKKLTEFIKQPIPEYVPPEEPEEPEEPIIIVPEFNSELTFDCSRTAANKPFCWLPFPGSRGNPGLRGRLKFYWPTLDYTLIVPDGAVTHGEDGNPKNHAQPFYFSGQDFEPSEGENNNWQPSVFGPMRATAPTVIMYFNK